MNNNTQEIDNELKRLQPSAEETEALRQAFLKAERPLPDVDDEWAKIQAHFGIEEKHSPLWKYAIPLLAAAACLAAVFLMNVSQPTKTNKDVAQNTTTASQPAATGKQQKENTTLSGASTQSSNTADITPVVCSTTRGEDAQLTLRDGTRVWLNSESQLIYPSKFTGSERKVRLSGEAYFEVHHDPYHPFIVETNYLSATVLGTEFNVRAYTRKDANIVLVNGRVAVGSAGSDKQQILVPGQKASLTGNGSVSISEVNTYPYVQRRKGFFYFDNQSMHDIMSEIGRWYGKTVVFENAQASKLRLHFVSERHLPLNNIVEKLNRMDSINVRLDKNEIVVH